MSKNKRVDQIIEMLKQEPGYDPDKGAIWEAIVILEGTQRANEALAKAVEDSVPKALLPAWME